MKIKKVHFEYIGFALVLLLALVCVLPISFDSRQAFLPIPMPQGFVGEYSYDGQTWQDLTDDTELSASQSDLFLRGHFLREMQEGWQLNFYRNHIGVWVAVNGETIYIDDILGMEDMGDNIFASMCAREWITVPIAAISADDEVEIRLHNPHHFGNETAYTDFLTTLCSDSPEWSLLQKNLAPHGRMFRVTGGMLAVASLMLLGAAIAAVIVRIPVGGILLKLGFMTLFAGGYMVFDTIDISLWNEWNAFNTHAGYLCMLLASFCFGHLVAEALTGKRQRVAKGAVFLTAFFDCVLMALSFTGITVIYDTLPYWVLSQVVLCPFYIVCCILELGVTQKGKRLMPISGILMSAAILMDIAGIGDTIVWRSPCSKVMFVVLFAAHVISGARGVVENHSAALRAAKLEKELEESRIAIMLSQIKPHFLYNVLNTIYHLYRKEPETAQEAVNSFAEYLRCNMLSIEKTRLIPFSEEYRHIQTYLDLEQIRFRGKLEIIYDVECSDFKLPPLTVEPLVENAVKHGVTKKRGGGTVKISARREETCYIVTVADTGVGFDPEHYMDDGRAHIGIRNARERLENMAGGKLSITSGDEGTVAVVTVPVKEAEHRNEDRRS